ncbi:MAG: hypothetical protein AAB527_03360 [Patescibacteria group bacterium]
MLRSRSEIVEIERRLNESRNIAKDAAETAEKNKNPCASEAKEWLNALEEELLAFMQFKYASPELVEGALAEVEDKFFQDFAAVLSHQKTASTNLNAVMIKEEIEKAISPALAYDKIGKPKLPPSADEARKRASLLWHRKFILEWLIKQSGQASK